MGLEQDQSTVREARRMEDTDRIVRRSILQTFLLYVPASATLLVVIGMALDARR